MGLYGFWIGFLIYLFSFLWMEMMVSLGILSYQQYVRLIGNIFSFLVKNI